MRANNVRSDTAESAKPKFAYHDCAPTAPVIPSQALPGASLHGLRAAVHAQGSQCQALRWVPEGAGRVTPLCPVCKLPDRSGVHQVLLPLERANVCLGAQQEATLQLLQNIGDRAACSGCNAEIYWVRHKSGKRTPYDPSGLNHFVSCPKAEQFSTRKKVS